ncbi:MAG: transposase family protein [Cyanobacteria bacterium]|nr:transposase family protein [Cyanobacteria bacterium bin.275]
MLKSDSAATDLDLISYLKAIPDARMRRGVRIPAWYFLLVAVLGILSRCQSLRDLERFAIRYHSVLTEALGLELRRPPSDSAFRYFFRQVDVASLCVRRSSSTSKWKASPAGSWILWGFSASAWRHEPSPAIQMSEPR